MKILSSLVMVAMFSSMAHAQMSSVTGYTAEITDSARKCHDPSGDISGSSEATANCFLFTTLVSPLISTSTLAAVAAKEEVQEVQPDALNYLAGDPMSEALEEVVAKLKEQNEELSKLSEEEVIRLIASIQV